MQVRKLEIPGAGTWARDCELLYFCIYEEFKLEYRREEDDTYWCMKCERIAACKILDEEFSLTGYLIKLPDDGAFFEIWDSPWLHELEKHRPLNDCKHYVLRFYDCIIEIIAQAFTFKKLDERPKLCSGP